MTMKGNNDIPQGILDAAAGLLMPYAEDAGDSAAFADRLRTCCGASKGQNSRPAALLPIDEVARRLACSRRQVFRLIECGRLPAVRLGNRSTRVPEHSVEVLVNGLGEGNP